MKVNGLFLDYDGTIGPLNVPRRQSRVLPHLEALLRMIQKSIPVGIISTKDLNFILPRTNFARAWCAIGGLEMKIGSQLIKAGGAGENINYLRRALQYAKQNICEGGVVEDKCDSGRRALAFCVDWRQAKGGNESRMIVAKILAFCKTLPLEIIECPGEPYFDVYPSSINKGKALRTLKEHFGLRSGVLYMGDSPTDNPAFNEADISIGVTGRENAPDLDCHYWVKFDDVARFLGSLFKNHLVFSPDLPVIRVRELR